MARDRDGVIARAHAAGVGRMVIISTRVRAFATIKEIIEQHESVFGTIGTHPHYAGEERDVTLDEIIAPTAHHKVIGIGEAGLDYFYDKAPKADQMAGFIRHIEAARATGLPLVIHTRDADDDTIRVLETEMARGAFAAVLHCFTGGQKLADCAVALGHYVSFTGVITFKKSEALRAVAASVPLDRLLVESDAPYLAPEPFRGKLNEPAHVVHTAACLAALKGVTVAEFSAITSANTLRFYHKMPALPLPAAGARVRGRLMHVRLTILGLAVCPAACRGSAMIGVRVTRPSPGTVAAVRRCWSRRSATVPLTRAAAGVGRSIPRRMQGCS